MARAAERILVVDDEPALLKMIGTYLRRMGFTVVTSTSAEEAWAAFVEAAGEFSLAVLDGSMAGTHKNDLGGRLLQASPRLCAIVSSGYPWDMTAMEAVAPGRAIFLQKPYTSEMLKAAVRGILAAQEKV
jgi:DNA-binding NtrC family response regulator